MSVVLVTPSAESLVRKVWNDPFSSPVGSETAVWVVALVSLAKPFVLPKFAREAKLTSAPPAATVAIFYHERTRDAAPTRTPTRATSASMEPARVQDIRHRVILNDYVLDELAGPRVDGLECLVRRRDGPGVHTPSARVSSTSSRLTSTRPSSASLASPRADRRDAPSICPEKPGFLGSELPSQRIQEDVG